MKPDKSLLYYFAHPYTGAEKSNFVLANHRTVKLLDAGYKIFSPVTMTHPINEISKRNNEFWMDFLLPFIEAADALMK